MKCSIISFYPGNINEYKPGLHPNRFQIPKSDGSTPSILVIEDCSQYIRVYNEQQPTMRVPVLGEDIAKAIVDDWLRAKLACSPGEIQPAIFWLEGEWTFDKLKKEKQELINAMLELQGRWFEELIKLADDDWAKRPGSHRLVTDDAKFAAKVLKLERPWLLDTVAAMNVEKVCKGCASSIPQAAIVCRFCMTVQDEKAYSGLKLAQNQAQK